jgi:hypothetical protein
MQTLVKNIDQGFYQEADKAGIEYAPYFAVKAAEAGVGPTDAELERRTQAMLAEFGVKPHETRRAARVRQHAFDTYAVDEVFRNARLNPAEATVEKAFAQSDVQSVFPVWYDSRIVEGILETAVLDALISESVTVDQMVTEHIELTETASDRAVTLAGEFTTFNELTVRYEGVTVRLRKKGARLAVSDEAREMARLPVLAAYLRRFGQQIAIAETDEALDTMLTGATTVPAANPDNPVYADLVSLWLDFANGYRPDTAIAPTPVWVNLLNMSEIKDPMLFTVPRDGSLPSLFGWRWERWDSTASTLWATLDKILVFQRSLALVQYQRGGIRSESGRVINGQFTETITSLMTGYAKLDEAAVRVGTEYAVAS